MLKGQSKAKLEKYNKKDEFIIMFYFCPLAH